MSGRVQTVLGDVSPAALGYTLTHEHLSMDFNHLYKKPPSQLADIFLEPLALKNVGYLRQYPYSSEYNLVLNDNDARCSVLEDVTSFKKYGGGTIVENSTVGLNRDLKFCKQVSEETGIHVVAGTGYYISDMQPYAQVTQEAMYEHMVRELTEGSVDDPGINAGFMGEIASVWPLKDFEIKAIKAAGEAQSQIKCGVSFHPHRVPAAPFEILRLYLEAGGAADKAVMSHLDRTLLDDSTLLEFSKLGCYCQLDLFGVEVSYYQLNVETDMPSDARRIEMIQRLVEEGKEGQILMSHDIHTKHRLVNYGGHGYSHILNNVLPKMKIKGFSQETLHKISVENPATWLTIKS